MARSAGDTWDIVTSVGFTALAVCAARALDAGLQPPLANDDFAAGFVAAAGEPNLIAAVDNADMSSAAAFNAQWVGVRTRFFDEFFADATRSGTRQAVILAAGLDSRAYRLDWPAGHTVYEVDQPRVLAFKQQVLDRQGAVPSTRRITVATDLRDDWAGALIAAGFDPDRPTAWALEDCCRICPGRPRMRCSKGCTSCRRPVAILPPNSVPPRAKCANSPTMSPRSAKTPVSLRWPSCGTTMRASTPKSFWPSGIGVSRP